MTKFVSKYISDENRPTITCSDEDQFMTKYVSKLKKWRKDMADKMAVDFNNMADEVAADFQVTVANCG